MERFFKNTYYYFIYLKKNVLFLVSPYLEKKTPYPGELGFSRSSDGKESACNAGELDLIPGLGTSPGGGHGNPFQYSCLENPHGPRSLAGYRPWGRKESHTTEWLSTAQHSGELIFKWNENESKWQNIFATNGEAKKSFCKILQGLWSLAYFQLCDRIWLCFVWNSN